MSKEIVNIKTLKLAHTKEGTIGVSHIEQPYGEYSSPVVSIGVSTDGKEQQWKVHIPYENIDELIKALNEARAVCRTLPHTQLHTRDLNADTGGGQ